MSEVATYVKFEELPETVRFNIIADVVNCFWNNGYNTEFDFSFECIKHVESMYSSHTIAIWKALKWIKEIAEFAKDWRFRVISPDINDELFDFDRLKFGYHLSTYKV